MTEFDYDVKSRKALVPSARRKKGGSKSKKCTLPMDYMTKGELNKMNGAVVSINMNKPYTIDMLKLASKELQAAYINNLRERYKASSRMLGEMFGTSQPTTLRYLNGIGCNVEKTKAPHPSAADRKAWKVFISGGEQKKTVAVEPVTFVAEVGAVAVEEEKREPEQIAKSGWNGLVPSNGLLEYSATVREICEALVYTLGAGTKINVTVRFNREEELKCSES